MAAYRLHQRGSDLDSAAGALPLCAAHGYAAVPETLGREGEERDWTAPTLLAIQDAVIRATHLAAPPCALPANVRMAVRLRA